MPLQSAQPDAPPDASASCAVGDATTVGTDRGKVGLSTGGGQLTNLACGSGELVGLALDMSDQGVNGTPTPSAHGIELGCATLTIDRSGAHTSAMRVVALEGSGGAGFTPSTMTPVTQCPEGAVVSGLAVHGGPAMDLFLDATLYCTGFNPYGNPTSVTSVYVSGTSTDEDYPSSVQCNAGEHVIAMTADTGGGLDSLRVKCAATTCQ